MNYYDLNHKSKEAPTISTVFAIYRMYRELFDRGFILAANLRLIV